MQINRSKFRFSNLRSVSSSGRPATCPVWFSSLRFAFVRLRPAYDRLKITGGKFALACIPAGIVERVRCACVRACERRGTGVRERACGRRSPVSFSERIIIGDEERASGVPFPFYKIFFIGY